MKKQRITRKNSNCLISLYCCLFWILALLVVPSVEADDIPQCRNTLPVIAPDDLTQVLFVVAGKVSDQEQGNLDMNAIMADTTTALDRAGIKATVVDDETSIHAIRFLRIRIYSIMLERQVYFCSAKVIQRQPSGEECYVREYSNVVSLARKIREVTADLVEQVLQDVRR